MNESDVFDAIYVRTNWIVAGPKSISGRGLVEYSYSMSRSSICIRDDGRWTKSITKTGEDISEFCETLSG